MTISKQKNLTDVVYDSSACIQCGMCIEVCPFNVWELPDNGPAIMARPWDCTNCTACAKNCPTRAISVVNFGCGCIWNQMSQILSKRKSSPSENECCENVSQCCGK